MTIMNEEEKKEIIQKNPHLKEYLDRITRKMNEPVFYSVLPFKVRDEKYPNLIYPGKGSIFIHVYKTQDMDEAEYHAIEPQLDENEQIKYEQLQKLIVKYAPKKESIITDEELKRILNELTDELIEIDENAVKAETDEKKRLKIGGKKDKIKATSLQKENIRYYLIKNIVGGGPLECFMQDPYLEDIHIVTGQKIHLTHKVFGMIKTNVEIPKEEGQEFARKLSEKMGSPVSEGNPIADGVLPDGSRGNLVYSDLYII